MERPISRQNWKGSLVYHAFESVVQQVYEDVQASALHLQASVFLAEDSLVDNRQSPYWGLSCR